MVEELSRDQLSDVEQSLLTKSNKVADLVMRNLEKFEGSFKPHLIAFAAVLCTRALAGISSSNTTIQNLYDKYEFNKWADCDVDEIHSAFKNGLLKRMKQLIVTSDKLFKTMEVIVFKGLIESLME